MIEVIEKSGVKYVVDYDNNQIEAYVTNCIAELQRFTDKVLGRNGIYDMCFDSTKAIEDLRSEYRGVAKCHPADVFDKQYGMDLARERAVTKRELAYNKVLRNYMEDAIRMTNALSDALRERSAIFGRHYKNLGSLSTRGITLKEIYNLRDQSTITIDGMKARPHCCHICNKTDIILENDKDYLVKDNDWLEVKDSEGKIIEVCADCLEEMAIADH